MSRRGRGLPPLDELAGPWMPREDLAHLPTLRNRWGQAHVNDDLTSLSWLAMPPYAGGYRTGVLRIDGEIARAERLRWSPWGVQRVADCSGIRVLSDTRMAYEDSTLLWKLHVENTSEQTRVVEVEQELISLVATSEVDWGWLYGTPWNAGHYHDFYATERLRGAVLGGEGTQVQLRQDGERWVRLGSPRIPGIQRDEDSEPMLLEHELPDHSTSDSGRVRASGAAARIRGLAVVDADGGTVAVGDAQAVHPIGPDTDIRAGRTELPFDSILVFEVELADGGADGVVLTHGNHPDSLQFGVSAGLPWFTIGGERVLGDTSLTPGSWHRVELRVAAEGASASVDGEPVGRTRPWWSGQRWLASTQGETVAVIDSLTPARSAFAFSERPHEIVVDGSRAFARWRLELEPGAPHELGVVVRLASDEASADAGARAVAERFEVELADVAERWRESWLNAFTPGNPEFSGYLPTLHTKDSDLARSYYLGVLLALYMRNTKVSPIGPVTLTGGPRLGATTTFYWDQSEWARVAAMLDPVGHRNWILAALGQPYESSHSFDTKNLLPVGNHYAANDHALFRIVSSYIGVTGDLALLDETARGRTVREHLRDMAYRPRETRVAFRSSTLADLGRDAWELLECVPNYRDAVVSFNAGYVGMLREFAELARIDGDEASAAQADAEAEALAHDVMGQYAGGGRWMIAHPEGDETIGHCLDFELVAADMTQDLSPAIRGEMVDFVVGHLIDGDWMRALSPDDPIAPLSDRPDHGAAGAFAAWPGATAYGLCRLGRADVAAGVLRRAHRATSGGLWGQAMEAIGDGRFRVAERGVSNRESNAAVAVSEAVIAGLFGVEASVHGLRSPVEGSVESAWGRLSNIRAVGFDLQQPSVDSRSARDLSVSTNL
ncbi:hypothetical protein [Compostimonas suwonensis]|uniref:Alpha-L-rhamnosidase six-hairpin glycosidase domain-containing protein n=1 Tax=Compostimonas suwonensis TaxID=1048394 RepID=A0A2M9BVC6_9MICO|nr:hypothetical protein [Compostimonas suwonensis]PJJ61898.1 hypothetical protein CLV54_1685 [Compostimonas suwonensis]